MYTISGTDRRKHPRAEIICPAIIQTKHTVISGETQNISAGGALIRCHKRISPNEVINIFISVSLLNPRVSVSAKVIRSSISYSANEAGPYSIGVEFRAVSDQNQELISSKIAEHLEAENIDWREKEPEK